MRELIDNLDALRGACKQAVQEMQDMRASSFERLVIAREVLRATAPQVRAGAPPWPQDAPWNRARKPGQGKGPEGQQVS